MAISIRETVLLREVLVTLTNISTGTINTLIDLSNGKATSTQAVKNEISRLQASVEATTGLIAFYEQKLHQEAEKGVLGRHMEDAKVLTDAIRALRRDERSAEKSHHSQHQHEIGHANTAVEYRLVDSSAVNYTPPETSDLNPSMLESLRRQMEIHIHTVASHRVTSTSNIRSTYGSPEFQTGAVSDHLAAATPLAPATLNAANRQHSTCIQEKSGDSSQLRRTRSTPFGGAMKSRAHAGGESASIKNRLPSVQETSSLKGRSGWNGREAFNRTRL